MRTSPAWKLSARPAVQMRPAAQEPLRVARQDHSADAQSMRLVGRRQALQEPRPKNAGAARHEEHGPRASLPRFFRCGSEYARGRRPAGDPRECSSYSCLYKKEVTQRTADVLE